MKEMKLLGLFSRSKCFFSVFRNPLAFRELTEEEICRPLIQLKHRPFLAGSDSANLNETVSTDVSPYFKGLALNFPMKDLNLIGKSIRGFVDEHIETTSAFLFRHLPATNAAEFQDLVNGMNMKPLVYDSGNASRKNVDEHIYTASDEPKEISIEPHNEMCYLEDFPTKIFFFCVSAADHGGDSPVVFNRDVMENLDRDFVEDMKQRKIQYVRNLKHENNSDYITWQETFKTKDKKKVEEIMRREKMEWRWKENGDLRLWSIKRAVLTHPRTGEDIWFNQLTAAHCSYYKAMPMNVNNQEMHPNDYTLNTCYGDGEQFKDEIIDHVRAALWNNAMSLKLQPGDLLVLDNLLAMHSRMSYEGGKRNIIVHLAN